ncbi:Hpt domain-containing protein [Actinoplanes sp. NEAU-A12]|uniref:Hpt domain-containing protein n=1 Tax=Actinoplanes sandaracinus TaxID=3045177 RepID=A0ABT6WMF3_9ACTN|nr:Hpt domain-containing protein [Actinoplanes sandaracinus]MDI6100893.1 Hpt domain-containing protein [Actinoplanes sandaracinus]
METAAQPEDRDHVAGVRARLADLVEGAPSPAELALVLRLLRSFAAKAPLAANELVRLLRAGDPVAVRDHAHSLKGSAANVGATGLAAVCAQVEDRARAGVVADVGPTAARLRSETDGAVRAAQILTDEYERVMA